MITKRLLPVIAIIMVCMFILPGYVQAVEYVDKTIQLEVESEYQDEHDEVVNVANESSIQNPDTWDPAPQGIWIGASTRESKFKFDAVASASNTLQVGSAVRFNSTQIMNGVSQYIVRSPISASTLSSLTLDIVRFTGNISYSLEAPYAPDYDGILIAKITVDLSDTSITTGSDAWTINDRTYVLVNCPLYSGINYAFIWRAVLLTDQSFTIYISGQDIANDNIMDTKVSYSNAPVPDLLNSLSRTFEVDPGISWDMLVGIGNTIYGRSYYFYPGDNVTYEFESGLYPGGYHTLMVPFMTDDGDLNATVTVYRKLAGGSFVEHWNDTDVWDDYILACSITNFTTGDNIFRVVITIEEEKRVSWVFHDSPSVSAMNYLTNSAFIDIEGVRHTIFSKLWASYQISILPVVHPSMDPNDFPPSMREAPASKANWYGTIIGAMLIVAGGLLVATGIFAPIGVIVAGVGTALIIADLASQGHLLDGDGPISGFMTNAMDAIRDALDAIGEFIISIGEGLWDALTWLADAIIEFGAYLIGILLIAVAMYIFFYPIQYQLKLWSFAWAMADGDLRGAGREANGLLRESGKAIRTSIRMAGKVDRRVKVARKAYSKWQKGREADRKAQDQDGEEQ